MRLLLRLICVASLKPPNDLRREEVSWGLLNCFPRTLTLAATTFAAFRLRTQEASKVIARHVSLGYDEVSSFDPALGPISLRRPRDPPLP